MKKIVLGLFLIFGALSFASPSFVDVDKIKQNSYEIYDDDDDFFTFVKSTDEAGISVTFTVIEGVNAKEVSDIIKSSTPDNQQFLNSINNKRAYVNKFRYLDVYTYNFVPKKQKVKDCHISVLYMTKENLSGEKLNKVIDKILNDAESVLK